ncbi:MAG: FGGY-family carbohydrate kinase, partial [Desulfohalobiaceae bacterium]
YLPFDYPRQNWLPRKNWKWHLFRVRPWQLPRLLPPGHILGNIQPQASQETGLPQGLPIVAAAADKACEVLGAGCIHNQQACLGLGTTATINVCSNRYKTPKPLLPAYPAAVPGMYNLEIQNFRGFWLVSWFKHQFGHQEMQQAEHRNMSPEEILNLMLDQTQPGSLGLMVQPFWTPGLRSPGPEAKGSILGFGDVHSRAHVYRALLEGLAYALLQGKLDIEKRLGQDIETLVAAGGGARSDQVLQLLADVFGQEVHRPHTFEASGLGAAINLARGLGFYPDFSSAIQSMTRTEPGFIPNKRNHRLYKALFSRVYQKLYPRLRHLYQELREITGYPE